MKKTSEILTWVFFGSEGITDNSDLMRCHMLTSMICHLGDDATVEAVKNTSAYLSCLNDIPKSMISDEKIQEMIDWEFKKTF